MCFSGTYLDSSSKHIAVYNIYSIEYFRVSTESQTHLSGWCDGVNVAVVPPVVAGFPLGARFRLTLHFPCDAATAAEVDELMIDD